ncbi:MAG: hypothetical protein ACI4LM_05455, partial [Anaerovoracaceae bacterium]
MKTDMKKKVTADEAAAAGNGAADNAKAETGGDSGKWRLWPYFQTIPGILYYQIVSAVILSVVLYGIRMLSSVLISSTGHEAITTGDFKFLFTTWQGWVLILLAVVVLCLYAIFDL